MLKSKSISDFMEAKLRELRVDVAVPVDLHLYFHANNHIMAWLPAGAVVTQEQMDRYKTRGIDSIWIHSSDWSRFQEYLHPKLETPAAKDALILGQPTPGQDSAHLQNHADGTLLSTVVKGQEALAEHLIYNSTASAQKFLHILRDGSRDDREKGALVAKFARQLLGALSTPCSLDQQETVSRAIAKTVHDFVVEISPKSTRIVDPAWAIASFDPELNHGVNVATLTVLLALSFGKIDENLLGEISVAALLHDVGISSLRFELARTLEDSIGPDLTEEYHSHAEKSAEYVARFAPDFADRVPPLVKRHHRSFGTSVGAAQSDVAQLVSIADHVDALCRGHVDGTERTVLESLFMLEAREDTRAQTGDDNRQFNKGLFTAILRWIRANVPEHSVRSAEHSLASQAEAS
jgi:hypothetical protein